MNTSLPQHLSWSALHDLALINLVLAHGPGGQELFAEDALVQQTLQRHSPEAPPQRIRQALRDALLVYVGAASEQMLDLAVVSLGQVLPRARRVAVLEDLADLASADGHIVPSEIAFIQQLARRWNVEQELQPER